MKKCTTYFEENNIITYDKYVNLMEKLEMEEGARLAKDIKIRKAIFKSAKNQTQLENRKESVIYSICMKNFKMQEIFLEKKTMYDGMVFKSHIKISKKDAEKLLNGQIEWMKHYKSGLFHDFYLACKFNYLQLAVIRDSDQDVCSQINGLDGIVLKHSIRCASIESYEGQFFGQCLSMVDVLNCDMVFFSYRRNIHIPQAVSNIVHLQNETKCEVAYSL